MDEILKRDQNRVTVMGAVTDDANRYVRNWLADAATGRLLVNAVVAGTMNGKLRVSGADTLYDYLSAKVFSTDGSIVFNILNPGGAELLDMVVDQSVIQLPNVSGQLDLATQVIGVLPTENGGTGASHAHPAGDRIWGFDIATDMTQYFIIGAGLHYDPGSQTLSAPGGTGYSTVQHNGVALPDEPILNFLDYFTITDDAGNTRTNIAIDTAGIANDTTFINTLVANNTFLNALANSNTFIDYLLANTYFTTNLGNNTNFINTLTSNSTFISNVVNIINTNPGVTIDLTTQVTGILPVDHGGTGVNSLTPYAPIFGGTTSTGPVQSGTVGTAGQVLTSNGAGMLPTFQNATGGSNLVASFYAGESIATKDAVYLDSSIQFDASSTDVTAGAVTSQTFSHTVTTNDNRYLIVGVSVDPVPGGQVTGITYNGVAMTLIRATGLGANPYTYLYGLIAPDTGTHNVVVSTNLAMKMVSYAASFYGVDQVTGVGANNGINDVGGAVIPYSVPITTSDQSVMIVDMGMSFLTGSLTPGTDQITIVNTNDSSNTFTAHGSYKKQKAIGATTMSWNQTSHNWAAGCVILLPFTGIALYKADASTAATADGFIGFANSAIALGATGLVTLGGLISGMSGLLIGTQYYLSDIAGIISDSAGTVTRKVGIATSTTELLITNIW